VRPKLEVQFFGKAELSPYCCVDLKEGEPAQYIPAQGALPGSRWCNESRGFEAASAGRARVFKRERDSSDEIRSHDVKKPTSQIRLPNDVSGSSRTPSNNRIYG